MKNSPDILGYCGDAFFPSQVLSQIVDIADAGLLFDSEATCKEKFEAIKEKVIQIFSSYPQDSCVVIGDYLGILHASRDYRKEFFCHKIEWRREQGWSGTKATFSDHSDKLMVLGSGRSEFLKKFERYSESENKKTSRAVFHCFCDTLSEIKDEYCGGAPQLVGLYRKYNAINFGIIQSRRRYLLGVDITNLKNLNNIEWRNELFERCNGLTMKLIEGAQHQPNPLKGL